jgi:hypothetical protein
MTRVAICHWGLARTLSTTFETHIKHLYQKFDENNIQYDKYMHTWIHPTNTTYDFTPYKFKKYEVEDQTDLIKYIDDNLSEYWYKDLFDKYGGHTTIEWYPHLVKSGLYSMVSLKSVTIMCLNSGVEYDYIIYMRPDCYLMSDVDLSFINMVDNSIIVPRDHGGCKSVFGIDDAIVILPFKKCKDYGFRFDETKEYRKNIGRIAGEHYIGWIVKKYFENIIYTDIQFTLCRANGFASGP